MKPQQVPTALGMRGCQQIMSAQPGCRDITGDTHTASPALPTLLEETAPPLWGDSGPTLSSAHPAGRYETYFFLLQMSLAPAWLCTREGG